MPDNRSGFIIVLHFNTYCMLSSRPSATVAYHNTSSYQITPVVYLSIRIFLYILSHLLIHALTSLHLIFQPFYHLSPFPYIHLHPPFLNKLYPYPTASPLPISLYIIPIRHSIRSPAFCGPFFCDIIRSPNIWGTCGDNTPSSFRFLLFFLRKNLNCFFFSRKESN